MNAYTEWIDADGKSRSTPHDSWEACRVDESGQVFPRKQWNGMQLHDYFSCSKKGINLGGEVEHPRHRLPGAHQGLLAGEWVKVATGLSGAGVLHKLTTPPVYTKLGKIRLVRFETGEWNSRLPAPLVQHRAKR